MILSQALIRILKDFFEEISKNLEAYEKYNKEVKDLNEKILMLQENEEKMLQEIHEHEENEEKFMNQVFPIIKLRNLIIF